LSRQTLLQDTDHRPGIIHAVDFNSLACDWEQNATSAAADLQHRTAEVLGQIEVERRVDEISHRTIRAVVILGRHVIGIDYGRHRPLPEGGGILKHKAESLHPKED